MTSMNDQTLNQAKSISSLLKELQHNLSNQTFEGIAGNRDVAITLDGNFMPQQVHISNQALQSPKQTLEGMIKDALINAVNALANESNHALKNVAKTITQKDEQ